MGPEIWYYPECLRFIKREFWISGHVMKYYVNSNFPKEPHFQYPPVICQFRLSYPCLFLQWLRDRLWWHTDRHVVQKQDLNAHQNFRHFGLVDSVAVAGHVRFVGRSWRIIYTDSHLSPTATTTTAAAARQIAAEPKQPAESPALYKAFIS